MTIDDTVARFPASIVIFHIGRAELMGSIKLGNVWVFAQLIHSPTQSKNQLYKNQNIA